MGEGTEQGGTKVLWEQKGGRRSVQLSPKATAVDASRIKPKLFSTPSASFPCTSLHENPLLQTHSMAFYSTSPSVVTWRLLYVPHNPTITSFGVYTAPAYVVGKHRLCLLHLYIYPITAHHTMLRSQQVPECIRLREIGGCQVPVAPRQTCGPRSDCLPGPLPGSLVVS